MPYLAFIILGFVIIQRITELVISNHNTKKLIASGSKEYFSGHYPLIVALHFGWILALALTISKSSPVNIYLLVIYFLLQIVRYYIIISLHGNWTTRILRNSNRALVSQGIYKYIKHPNYIVIAVEIYLLPLIFGLWSVGFIFGTTNLFVLGIRIHYENKALAMTS
jgi:methyltransferase